MNNPYLSNCAYSILGCGALSLTYVSSLYVWKTTSRYHRDHPSTVKRRFLSVLLVALVSPLFVLSFSCSRYGNESQYNLWELLGLRTAGLLMACTVPLMLTMILFLGPLAIQKQSGTWMLYSEPMYWINNLKNIHWLRDHIVAPLSEELTFRACMIPLLVSCFRPHNAVFICPVFFGVAHIHHIYERLKSGFDLKSALLLSGFQVLYTTIFGAYSAYLFLRTGHFVAPFIVHAFCNHMGFPDFSEVIKYNEPKRTLTLGICVVGLISWCLLLTPLTNPSWYSNNIYWKTEPTLMFCYS
ncbi:ras converting CAAX endopeptidase Sras [Rhodnius prolixus]|uniref:ras converting CAAX endopeptidase Sras n=1 Tax=Rhodnius prolixus TaxID=13249 RepID=UPI003D18A5FC